MSVSRWWEFGLKKCISPHCPPLLLVCVRQIKNKPRIIYLDISNRDLVGSADLSEFTKLKSLNTYRNKLESLDLLNSLPNKEKLQWINFYGNNLKEIDFAALLSDFPNLQALNIENNPVKAKNVEKLTTEQVNFLIEKIKEKKFRVNSYRGTVLEDLLSHIQSLIKQGDSSQTQNSHYLQTLLRHENSKLDNQNKMPTWIIGGGLTLAFLLVLLVGYRWGKKRRMDEDDEE